MPHGNITFAWRESFTNREIHALQPLRDMGRFRRRVVKPC